jgi:probable HAF family extracellular repeat protein
MLIAGTSAAWQAPAADALALEKARPATTYRVINLRPSGESLQAGIGMFNAHNQLAFSTGSGGLIRGWFYDGSRLVDIGSLNGRTTQVSDLNDAGQVVGAGFIRDAGTPEAPGEIYHAFFWSRARGIRDLGTLGGDGTSRASAINNLGQVVGDAYAPDGRFHAFLWSPREGMRDLGLLGSRPDSASAASGINEAGEVTGAATLNNGNYHAFLWTRQKGLQDLGTLGGTTSSALDIADNGLVAGESTIRGDVARHAFAWTRRSGMRDIGPAGRNDAFVQELSSNGHLSGFVLLNSGDRRPFSWTREGGLRILGTLGGSDALAQGGNNRREVVGGSFTTGDLDFHAFLWTPKDGMVDLNTRLRNAPAGLTIRNAYAISDDGYIFADSNAGVVLLVPDSCPTRTQSVGAIVASSLVPVGQSFASSVSTASEDKAASHNVLWNWGDGSGDQQGSMRMREGSGAASAQHAYAAPGVYTLQAKVADRSGQGATVSRTVVAYQAAPGVTAASGWFMSPRGAHKAAGSRVDRVDLSFLFPSGGKAAPHLSLSGTGLQFSSEDIRMVKQSGARGFEGSGSLNGRSGYRFSLNTAAGATDATGRVGLQIWHTDPASGAVVVDYDNAGSNGSGSAFRGEIQMH